MPPCIPGWTRALAEVDRSGPPSDTQHLYAFPEPALLVSAEEPGRRQQLLHHYQLVHDALIFRMGHRQSSHGPLTSQEWRDVLHGKVVPQGKQGSRAEDRTVTISRILGPAMDACGIDKLHDFPADPSKVPHTTINQAKELLWELAEMNFRYELLALDSRASGVSRPDKCKECLIGGMLVSPDLGFSKQGFAAMAPSERLPFLLRLAELMRDWRTESCPHSIMEAKGRQFEGWTADSIEGLEYDVAKYYTQSFYFLFGRAAVIPMRLEHELRT